MAEGTVEKPLVNRRRIIERPRLTRLLDDSPARIKMLVAPAGYGKTTLARQWVQTLPGSHVVTAIPRDANLTSVAAALAESVAHAGGTGHRLRDRLASGGPTALPEHLADILIEDLRAGVGSLQLLIDDYELIPDDSPAEAFVRRVLKSSDVSALVLSRRRPSWITARDLLYGDVLEVGATELAMTTAEAATVLAHRSQAASGVVALAAGWPAVIGLAALMDSTALETSDDLERGRTLHDYLADELFAQLSTEAQRTLAEVAASGLRSRRDLDAIIGEARVRRMIPEALAHGWLTALSTDEYDMHPLLEAFLREKLASGAMSLDADAVDQIVQQLIERELWEELFSVIETCRSYHLLPVVFRHGLRGMVELARPASLIRWVELSRDVGFTSPEVHLAEAEVALREGNFIDAERMALVAADAFNADDYWRSVSLIVAGRSAHAANRETESLAHFRAAKASAPNVELHDVALSGEVAAATDLELPEAVTLHASTAPTESNVDDFVIHVGRTINISTRFGIEFDLEIGRRAYRLLHRVSDPFRRCSFRNCYGYILASSGAVEEAREVADSQLREATHYRFDFVVPYAYQLHAISHLVRGELDDAIELIRTSRKFGQRIGDALVVGNSVALEARLQIARGEFSKALELTHRRVGLVNPSMVGEMLGVSAIAYACSGKPGRALSAARYAESLTKASEPRIAALAVKAIVAITGGEPDALERAATALSTSERLLNLEVLASAYRGFPALATTLTESEPTRDAALRALFRTGDAQLASKAQDSVSPNTGSWDDLSPREREVLLLVSAGMSNPEIARKLFLAEATVKVHVRHILEKLGAKNRTIAALRVPPHVRLRSAEDA